MNKKKHNQQQQNQQQRNQTLKLRSEKRTSTANPDKEKTLTGNNPLAPPEGKERRNEAGGSSMKDVAKKLASTSINEEDKAPAGVPLENSPMETDKSLLGENTSTPKTFRHRVNGEWIQVPKMGGAMTKRYLRYIKEGMSKEEAY